MDLPPHKTSLSMSEKEKKLGLMLITIKQKHLLCQQITLALSVIKQMNKETSGTEETFCRRVIDYC